MGKYKERLHFGAKKITLLQNKICYSLKVGNNQKFRCLFFFFPRNVKKAPSLWWISHRIAPVYQSFSLSDRTQMGWLWITKFTHDHLCVVWDAHLHGMGCSALYVNSRVCFPGISINLFHQTIITLPCQVLSVHFGIRHCSCLLASYSLSGFSQLWLYWHFRQFFVPGACHVHCRLQHPWRDNAGYFGEAISFPFEDLPTGI